MTYLACYSLPDTDEEVEIHRCSKCNGVFGVDATFLESDLREPPHAVCPMCIKDIELDEPVVITTPKGERNGFDRYLEWQYRRSGDFFTALFQAISKADTKNQARLSNAFPEEVCAVHYWTRQGVRNFAEYVNEDHGLLDNLRKEYGL